jgi:DNA invertase Pin-like site-specific DNA recombinase
MRDDLNAGMARAKASGTKSGKAIGRPRISRKIEQRIRDELAKGTGILKVAALMGVGSGTVQRIKAGKPPR